MTTPLVSVIITCFNGVRWLPNCFASLRNQTIFEKIEVVLVDDCSTDDSVDLAQKNLAAFPHAKVIRNNRSLGYTGSNNTGADAAKGEWLFILNQDTQLESDCLEQLIRSLASTSADAAVPALAEYDSMRIVPSAPAGFDLFGRPTWSESDHSFNPAAPAHPCFMVGGAAFLIRRDLWKKLGGFDAAHFMYAEDDDLSWKLWLAGYQNIYVPNAIVHHRDERGWEIKEFTRYLVNRNSLLVIAKNAQHILLLCGLLQIMMLIGEALLLLVVSRNWKFVRNSYFKAIIDSFKMWPHICEMRKFIRQIRRRSDWSMARMFLRLKINRWDMIKAFFLEGRKPVIR
jgi:GT2 family glycosyltransferase